MNKLVLSVFCGCTLIAGPIYVVGTTTPATGNGLPFGDPNANIGVGTPPLVRYQQVYASSALPGVIDITGVLFYNTQFRPGLDSITSGTYTIALSTTTKAVGG